MDSQPTLPPQLARRATAAVSVAAACSGSAALAYEICWSRALVVPLGNSTDSVAVVLGGFMLGMALGARLGGGVAERVASPLRIYALLEVLLAFSGLLVPRVLSELSEIPAALPWLPAIPVGVAARYAAALLVIALPCLAMGASLPLLARELTRGRAPLRLKISIVYGANTAGAALGAVGAGFWSIAQLGLSASALPALCYWGTL